MINNKKIKKYEINIKNTNTMEDKFDNKSLNNIKDLFRVEGKFCKSKFLLGIK